MALSEALSWLYPSRCGLCELASPSGLCKTCQSEFLPGPGWSIRQAQALDEVQVLFDHAGRAKQAVWALKFHRISSLGRPLSELLFAAAFSPTRGPWDAVIPVPIHWRRQWSRGFNQSMLLASAFPKSLVKTDWLVRIRHTRAQVGLTLEERTQNLIGAFVATPAARRKRILLLDDVLTSGSTAEECAKALKAVGADLVSVLTLTGGQLRRGD